MVLGIHVQFTFNELVHDRGHGRRRRPFPKLDVAGSSPVARSV
jgi:hypothetical protein